MALTEKELLAKKKEIEEAKQELKPCPFCGNKAEEFSNGVRCTNKWCFAKVEVNSDFISKSDLVYNWNSRV